MGAHESTSVGIGGGIILLLIILWSCISIT